MKVKIQRANDRGTADFGWLQANYSFSFANYYNPNRMGFGKLRVLNDDTIAPGKGFGTHPHQDMEIITLVTQGTLAHQDSTGGKGTIIPGQVQVMSAGTGILHSEFNGSQTEEARILQIWIEPQVRGVEPRYATHALNLEKNKLSKIVSSNKEDPAFIYQDANLFLADCDQECEFSVPLVENKGVFVMVVKGQATVAETILEKRDSIEIEGPGSVKITCMKNTSVLVIEVPL